jgi:putative SOS response-associated peptidase YedK
MCGRFTLTYPIQEIKEEFDIDNVLSEYKLSYNIAPSQNIAVVIEGSRILDNYRWGLVLPWMLKMKKELMLNNARIENIKEKPTYKHAFTKQRCLIPASGFYEWKLEKGNKIPHYITLKGRKIFAFAGIYSIVEDKGKQIKSCSIITMPSNSFMSKIHNRMPQIIEKKKYDEWINPEIQDKEEILKLLAPISSSKMEEFPVDMGVNNPRNNSPECILPSN